MGILRRMAPRTWVRPWVVIGFAAALGAVPLRSAAAPALDDTTAARDVDHCQRALAVRGRAVVSTRLASLGRCVARVFACEQQGGRAEACLEKAKARCAKDVAKADKKRARAVEKAEKSCRNVEPEAVLDPAGLGFGRLVRSCLQQQVPLAGAAQLVACVERRHACTAEEMLTLQYPRARSALAAAGIAIPEGACFGAVTSPEAFPIGKRGVACLKAATKGASAFAAKNLGGLQGCLTAATTCLQRKASDSKCFAKAAKRCAKTDAKATKIAEKLGRTLEKRCKGVEFASLSAAFGLADVAAVCTARGADVDSVGGWGSCLARSHRCFAEALLGQEVARAGELLVEMDRTLDAGCAALLQAVPGRDASVLLGETVVVIGGASGTLETPQLTWTLVDAPAGSAVVLADPTAATQSVTPDVAGDYVLSLVARAGGYVSAPATVTITALGALPPEPATVAVGGMALTLERDGLADPDTAILIAFTGPVDPSTLTSEHVVLSREDVPIASALSFDPGAGLLTVTPDAPLPLDGFFRVSVTGVGATASPAEFVPFAETFLTRERETAFVEGAVLDPDRNPISLVRVTVAGRETHTDERGRFRVEDVPEGVQELNLDPSTVDGDVVYTPLTFFVDVQLGVRPNGVGKPIILTVIDTTTMIDYPAERVLTSPRFPGLVVDLGASDVRNLDGSPYEGPLSVSPVGGRDVPMPFPGSSGSFWTIQPGGLLVDPPAVVTAPLPITMDAGDEIDLWAFDHATDEWVNYGTGVVDPGGATATSQPGGGLPFTGWHSVVTRREVVRPVGNAGGGPTAAPRVAQAPIAIEGTVVDGDLRPLHGVEVTTDDGGGQAVYTDYSPFFDGFVNGEYRFTSVLVGYNVAVNGTFDHFEPRDPQVCAVAETLLGDFFAECVVLDVSSLADPSQPDGALPLAVVAPDPIVIEDYTVIDDQNDIHLHADMVDRRRSHVIRAPFGDGAVESSIRYRDEVDAVTQKLASLGFRQEDIRPGEQDADFLIETSVFQAGFAAEKAVRLFQTIWLARGRGKLLWSRTGHIDEDELRGLNAIDGGVLWTRNDAFQAANGYRPQVRRLRNRMFHSGIPPKLTTLSTKQFSTGQPMRSTINSATRAIGGTRLGFNQRSRKGGHVAGSECDVAWIRTNGLPGSGLFYEPLVYTFPGTANMVAVPVPLSSRDVPMAAQEWTDADQQTSETMNQAILRGLTWRTKPWYSRALTQEYVDAIATLRKKNDAPILFNDPGVVCPVSRVVPDPDGPGCGVLSRFAGHSNHVHFGVFFDKNEVLPARTDDAPPFPRLPLPLPAATPVVAPGVAPPTGFEIVEIEPGHTPVPRDPDTSIEIEFSAPVDPATLDETSVVLSVQATGEPAAVTLRLDETLTHLTIVPAAGAVPENVVVTLDLSGAVRDATGRALALPDGDATVASYRTTLSNDVVDARFEPATLRLSRDDLSAATLQVVGTELDGGTRLVTTAAEEYALVDPAGHALEPVGEAAARLTRVFDGRATLQAFLSNGIEARSLVDADLVGSIDASPSVLLVGETLDLQFTEAVDAVPILLVEAEAVDASGERHAGSLTIDGDAATFRPGSTTPRFVPLALELVFTVTDPADETIDVVARVEFSVVGTGVDDADTDGDGLPDVVEDALGDCADATLTDTDGDGVTDDLEDCDDDTLTNGREVEVGTNPALPDTDGDGILDPMELNLACDPRVAETTMVVGRTVDGAAAAVADVGVRALGFTATSDAAGAFTIPNVPACPTRSFRVVANRDGTPPLEGVSSQVASIVGDVVDVGDVVLEPVLVPRYPDGHFVGDRPEHLALVDVDDDGVLDALAVNNGSDDVSVLLGRGDGTFEPEVRVFSAAVSTRYVATGKLNDDAHVDFVVSGTGGLSVSFGNGDGTFSAGVFVDVSGNPNGIAVADMNGDDVLDLVAASDGAGVVVVLGNGDGTFRPELVFDQDRDQTDVAVGFFNDDAALDVVTAGRAFISQSVGEVAILLGNGDGTLQAPQEFRTQTHRVHALLATDLDVDGDLDLIAGSFQPIVQDGPILGAVLRGNGDGTFQAAEPFTMREEFSGGRMALGQLTDDANPDLLVANEFLDLSLLAGNGDGTFQAPVLIPRGLDPEGLAVGDIDGDGVDDIVNSDTFDEQVWSLLGNGDGTFRVAGQTRLEVLFESGSGTARRYATADFDDDGNLDFVAAGHRRRLSVMLGKGDFSFEPHFGLEATAVIRTADVDVGDFDGDTVVDPIALTAEEVVVFPSNGDGTFGAGLVTTLGLGDLASDAEEIVATHLNGDAHLDVVATLGFNDQVATLLGNGDGTFQTPVFLTGVDRPMGLAVADLDDDGAMDVIVAPLQDAGLGIFRGIGDGTFAPVRFVGDDTFIQVAAIDTNGDTIVDLVATGYPNEFPPDQAAFVFLGNGDGTFQRPTIHEADECPEGMIAADLTGDDVPDIVTANCGADTLSIFVGNGDGTYQQQTRIGVGQPDQLTAGDLNGDGAPDLIVGTEFVDVGILPHR